MCVADYSQFVLANSAANPSYLYAVCPVIDISHFVAPKCASENGENSRRPWHKSVQYWLIPKPITVWLHSKHDKHHHHRGSYIARLDLTTRLIGVMHKLARLSTFDCLSPLFIQALDVLGQLKTMACTIYDWSINTPAPKCSSRASERGYVPMVTRSGRKKSRYPRTKAIVAWQ